MVILERHQRNRAVKGATTDVLMLRIKMQLSPLLRNTLPPLQPSEWSIAFIRHVCHLPPSFWLAIFTLDLTTTSAIFDAEKLSSSLAPLLQLLSHITSYGSLTASVLKHSGGLTPKSLNLDSSTPANQSLVMLGTAKSVTYSTRHQVKLQQVIYAHHLLTCNTMNH